MTAWKAATVVRFYEVGTIVARRHQKCVKSSMGSRNVRGPGVTAARGETMRRTVDSFGSWGQMHRVGAAVLGYCAVGV